MNDIPVIATAFGTSTLARDTYAFFEQRFRQQYPGREIFWAFSSSIIREKMKREQVPMQSIEEVLHGLEAQGCERAVIQSLHVIPGFEFAKTAETAQRSTIKTVMGMPLLERDSDFSQTIDCLAHKIPDPNQWATVLVGHGTSHPAGSAYQKLQRMLQNRYPENVFVSVVEGEPSWDDVCAAIKRSGVKNVKFIPLMFVAGEHIMNDVLGEADGDGDMPWKMQLAGYEIDGSEQGLGFNETIVDIYLQHTDEALRKLSGC